MKPLKCSLRFKTNLAILITFFSIALLFSAIHQPMRNRHFRTMTEKIELVLDTLVQRDQAPLGNEIFDGNIRAMAIRIKAMMEVKGMLAISVFDATGALLIQESRNPAIYDLTRLKGDPGIRQKRWGNTDTLTYLRAISVIGEPLGWIRICYSLEDIKKNQRYTNRIVAGLLASILIVMLAVLNLILSRTILRPITILRDAMEQVGRLRYQKRVHIESRDEVGDLAASFNRMSRDLDRFHREIQTRQEETNQVRLFLKNIIDAMPSVLVGINRDQGITHWNLQAEKITGFSPDRARGMAVHKIFAWKGFPAAIIEKSLREKKIRQQTKIPVTINGTPRFMDMTVYPLESTGKTDAVIRMDDVTDHVRMEEMVIQSEKMLSVGELAAGMAHEINNPLAGVLQNAAVIKNRLTGDLPANHKAATACRTTLPTIRSYMEHRQIFSLLDHVHHAGTRAADIVTDMLSFSRKGEGSFSFHQLNRLLDETLNLVSSDYNLTKHFDFKQILIQREYEASLPQIPCDKGKLQQVFLNILQNGAHAMAENPEKTSPDRFILRAKACPGTLQVEIEDNGPGISPDQCKRIFEPFFTTKPVGTGTGLGLSVSYFIITKTHNGSMEVASVPGKGTNFIIRLPIQQEEL
ncbi:MAG: HAMP domain-containing protein [Desulfobacteraceae bacterium]|nr:HAMP domain-containing protein [Desulfobacteraceae bacterium]